jgi:PIN domain nuclease of toxin-antitoxin system
MTDRPVLIDTHVWWWWENGFAGQISASSLRLIERAERDNMLRISAMSAWEIGMLDSKGRLAALPDPLSWIRRSLAVHGRALAPLTPEIAVLSNRLPDAPVGDPVDRILLATARVENLTLVTADRKLLDYGRRHHVNVLRV